MAPSEQAPSSFGPGASIQQPASIRAALRGGRAFRQGRQGQRARFRESSGGSRNLRGLGFSPTVSVSCPLRPPHSAGSYAVALRAKRRRGSLSPTSAQFRSTKMGVAFFSRRRSKAGSGSIRAAVVLGLLCTDSLSRELFGSQLTDLRESLLQVAHAPLATG